jgi:hypothetical protein
MNHREGEKGRSEGGGERRRGIGRTGCRWMHGLLLGRGGGSMFAASMRIQADASDPVSEKRDVEVDQEAKWPTQQLQVGE